LFIDNRDILDYWYYCWLTRPLLLAQVTDGADPAATVPGIGDLCDSGN